MNPNAKHQRFIYGQPEQPEPSYQPPAGAHTRKRRRADPEVDLTIDKIELSGVEKFPPVAHPVLPQHPFGLQISADKGSGKTNLIINLIIKHYLGYFHRIIVFSPSLRTDDKWYVARRTKHILIQNKRKRELLEGVQHKRGRVQRVVFSATDSAANQEREIEEPFHGKLLDEDLHEEFSLEDFKKVWEGLLAEVLQIEEKLGKKEAPNARYWADRVLIICDDQVGTALSKKSCENNPVIQFATRHRHLSASFIFVSQFVRGIPPGVRTQCNALIGFDNGNDDEKQKIYEDHPCGLKMNTWLDMYDYATEEPFSFVYFNKFFPRGQRCYKQFTHKLEVGSEEVREDAIHDSSLRKSSDKVARSKAKNNAAIKGF